MPILEENKKFYDSAWDIISKDIRENRAKNRCEECNIKNHSVGYRDEYKIFRELEPTWMEDNTPNNSHFKNFKVFKVVLTVAHLDHNPENNNYTNLKALCQKCHLNYDYKHHRETQLKNKFKDQLTLF
jgi:hypothetical protein